MLKEEWHKSVLCYTMLIKSIFCHTIITGKSIIIFTIILIILNYI